MLSGIIKEQRPPVSLGRCNTAAAQPGGVLPRTPRRFTQILLRMNSLTIWVNREPCAAGKQVYTRNSSGSADLRNVPREQGEMTVRRLFQYLLPVVIALCASLQAQTQKGIFNVRDFGATGKKADDA